MVLDLPRRFPWSTLLSIGIHGAVVAGLLYTSVHQVIELPTPAQPISVTMIASADLEPPRTVQSPPKPVVEPEPEPEPIPEPPKEASVMIEKPKPKSKLEPKPVKKVEEQPKRDVKPAEPRSASPVENTASIRTVTNTAPATTSKPVVSAPSDLRVLSRSQPRYPVQAQALRIEDRVKVKFNVTPDGRVENMEILSAQPANIFEHKVKDTMRRWRYKAGKPGSGLMVSIVFKLNDTTQIE